MGFVGLHVCAFFWREGQSFLANSLRCLDPEKAKSLKKFQGTYSFICHDFLGHGTLVEGAFYAGWPGWNVGVEVKRPVADGESGWGGDGSRDGTVLSAVTPLCPLMERWRRAFCVRHESASLLRQNSYDDRFLFLTESTEPFAVRIPGSCNVSLWGHQEVVTMDQVIESTGTMGTVGLPPERASFLSGNRSH